MGGVEGQERSGWKRSRQPYCSFKDGVCMHVLAHGVAPDVAGVPAAAAADV